MPALKDLTGMQFGRLTVIERAENKGKITSWKCKCTCGEMLSVRGTSLTIGFTKSCGCLNHEMIIERNTKHGMSETRLYSVYKNMIRRCYDSKSTAYPKYGAKGIDVCDIWRNSFENFRDWALVNDYSDELSIDRIENSKGYYPDNCRWKSMKFQQNNRTDNHVVTFNNESLNCAEWDEMLNFKQGTIAKRLYAGWSIERALTTPVNKRN